MFIYGHAYVVSVSVREVIVISCYAMSCHAMLCYLLDFFPVPALGFFIMLNVRSAAVRTARCFFSSSFLLPSVLLAGYVCCVSEILFVSGALARSPPVFFLYKFMS